MLAVRVANLFGGAAVAASLLFVGVFGAPLQQQQQQLPSSLSSPSTTMSGENAPIIDANSWPDFRRELISNPEFMNCAIDISDKNQHSPSPPSNVTDAIGFLHQYLPCVERVPSARPFIVVFHFVERHYDNSTGSPTRQSCGLSADASQSSSGTTQKELRDTALNTNGSFCDLWFNELQPAFCTLAQKCPQSIIDIDQEFAAVYALQQLARNHSTPFSCKNKNGVEQLQTRVDPRAYEAGYSFGNNPVLINRPTCSKPPQKWKIARISFAPIDADVEAMSLLI